MPVKNFYNFRTFTESIDTAGLLSEEQLSGLSADGYAAVVNLLPQESEYAIAGEREIIESQEIEYHYRPVDFAAPTEDDFAWFESTLKQLPSGNTLIHCAANFRVSAFSSLYAHRNLGWSADQVEAFIADVWDLSEHPVWKRFVVERLKR